MFADYHMHTSFSEDSNYPMEEVIKKAIDLGLDELCITDHSDYFRKHQIQVLDYEAYVKTYKSLKERYKGKITVKLGVEFGMQMHTIDFYERDFKAYDFDFVILSNHQIDDVEFWTGDFQRGKAQLDYNRDYYQAIWDVIHVYKNYSVLGHLDMIKRYDENGVLDDRENEAIIKKILKFVIDEGKGIEINTSSFRYNLPDLTPSRTILKWYYELGGTVLTIGSDSHKEEDVAKQIPYVRSELKKIGFESFCTFDKMKPTYHKL